MSSQDIKIKQAAQKLAPELLPNMGSLKWFAKLKGVDVSGYTDVDLLQIIRDACDIALSGCRSFTFKPVYT